MARKKKDFPWLLIGAAVVTFFVAVLLFTLMGERLFPPEKPPVERRTVVLYLSDETAKRLVPVERSIPKGSIEEELRATLKALLKDPPDGLVRTIPKGARLLSVKVQDGVAYVDFSGELVRNHPGGSSAELQTIYSIVNTAALNFAQIERVQILVEGRKRRTLRGHLLINIPLRPDKKLIRR